MTFRIPRRRVAVSLPINAAAVVAAVLEEDAPRVLIGENFAVAQRMAGARDFLLGIFDETANRPGVLLKRTIRFQTVEELAYYLEHVLAHQAPTEAVAEA